MSDYPPPPQDPNQPNPYGQQPPPGGYGQPSYGGVGVDHPRGTIVLVLGILSLVCLGLIAGIPAIIMGRSALAEIDAAPGRYTNRGTVKAGYICGIIGTALSALGLLFYLIVGIAVVSS